MIINDPTHNGPPGSRHGGVAASHFAKLVDPHRPRTRFHAFVPLGVPPTGHLADDGAVAISHGVTLLATGAPTDPVELFPDLPVPELADEVRSYAVERDRRPFPTRCGCDPARPRAKQPPAAPRSTGEAQCPRQHVAPDSGQHQARLPDMGRPRLRQRRSGARRRPRRRQHRHR